MMMLMMKMKTMIMPMMMMMVTKKKMKVMRMKITMMMMMKRRRMTLKQQSLESAKVSHNLKLSARSKRSATTSRPTPFPPTTQPPRAASDPSPTSTQPFSKRLAATYRTTTTTARWSPTMKTSLMMIISRDPPTKMKNPRVRHVANS